MQNVKCSRDHNACVLVSGIGLCFWISIFGLHVYVLRSLFCFHCLPRYLFHSCFRSFQLNWIQLPSKSCLWSKQVRVDRMLRLQVRAAQLRHVASLQLSDGPAGLRPKPGFKLPKGVCANSNYASNMSGRVSPNKELGEIKKLLVANRGKWYCLKLTTSMVMQYRW